VSRSMCSATPPLEHRNRLIENLLKGHRPSFLDDEACRRRYGHGTDHAGACIPHILSNESRKAWERVTQRRPHAHADGIWLSSQQFPEARKS
jgi:hypothetical protein